VVHPPDPSLIEGTSGVGGVETYSRNQFGFLGLVSAGKNAPPHLLVVIHDFPQLKLADKSIRGILGGDFLARFDLLIDNREHILCLDRSGLLANSVKNAQIALAEPRGEMNDLPFTRPMVAYSRISSMGKTGMLLRLDSGSNAPVLYPDSLRPGNASPNWKLKLKRVVDGVEQEFAVLSPQDVQIGAQTLRQVSFTVPKNAIGSVPIRREDGLLPTMAFRRVFISYEGGYAKLDNW
jgi:hypothetical protein